MTVFEVIDLEKCRPGKLRKLAGSSTAVIGLVVRTRGVTIDTRPQRRIETDWLQRRHPLSYLHKNHRGFLRP